MMAERKPLLVRMLFSTIAQGTNALTVVLFVLAARFLGETAFGQFSFALAFVSAFSVFADGGIRQIVVREIARKRARAADLLKALLSWRLILSSLTFLAIISVAWWTGMRGEKYSLVVLLGMAFLLRGFKLGLRSVCQALEVFEYDAAFVMVERTLLLVVGGAVLYLGGDVRSLAITFVVVRFTDLLFTGAWVDRRLVPVRFGWHWETIRLLQTKALPLAGAMILGGVHLQLEVLMLGWLRSDAEVGWYSAAFRAIEGFTMVPVILCAVLLPRLAAVSHESERHRKLFRLAIRWVLAASLPIVVGLLVFGQPLIVLVFGQSFVEATAALKILAYALPFWFLNWVLETNLISQGDTKGVLLMTMGSLSVGLLVNVLMTPTAGIIGASCAKVMSQAAAAAVGFCWQRRSGALALRTDQWETVAAHAGPVVATDDPSM